MARQLKNMMGSGMSAATAKLINGIVADLLTATGNSQATALQLTGDVNIINTVPASSGVILPPIPQPADEILVANLGANDLSIYPTLGGSIQGSVTNSPYVLTAGATVIFIARKGSVNWVVIANAGAIAPPAPTSNSAVLLLLLLEEA